MRFRLPFIKAAMLALSFSSATAQTEREIAGCAVAKAPLDRLSCYDAIARKLHLDSPQVEGENKGNWRLRQEKSKIDDLLTVILDVDGDTEFRGWLKTATPVLVLRCKEGKTEAYVITSMHAHVERSSLDAATVTIRLDDAKAFQTKMSESTDGEALFFPEAKSFILRLAKHKQMLFQFVPFNSSPTMTTFPINGLEEAIKPLRATCRW